jgi:hypothetical protein
MTADPCEEAASALALTCLVTYLILFALAVLLVFLCHPEAPIFP